MASGSANEDFVAARLELLRDIEKQVKAIGTGDGGFEIAPKVLDALRRVPREHFLPERERAHAYANTPLPIGQGQTISQPLIVALMTHLLRLERQHRVLEVGTGSGYQTAVLAELTDDIVTVENVPELAKAAKAALTGLGYAGIDFIEGDGRSDAANLAPFDRIIVTAAAEAMPSALVDQLGLGGRLVAPIGRTGSQRMVVVEKSAAGQVTERTLFPVAFVPLT